MASVFMGDDESSPYRDFDIRLGKLTPKKRT